MRALVVLLAMAAVWMPSMVSLAQEIGPPSGPRWSAAIERATERESPIIVFSRPPDCRDKRSRFDPCKVFEAVVRHPAIERRLETLVFLTDEQAGAETSVTVYDPAGARLIRWRDAPRGATFRQMLNLVDGARDHILDSWRARRDGDVAVAEQERVLALFSLGHAALGRAELMRLLQSENEESRQLAAIWFERLVSRSEGQSPDEATLTELGLRGSTDRVRFEAWMSLGELHNEVGNRETAMTDYRRAIALTPDPSVQRDIASVMLQRVADAAVPLVGLGGPGAVVAGRRTIQPLWSEATISRVEYRLDGKLVAASKRVPFAAAINFGRIPRRQELAVVALDAAGTTVRSASVVVNEPTNAFSVRIVEPSSDRLSGEAEVEVSVHVPAGHKVRRASLEWNGRVVAKMSAPPYRGTIRGNEGELGVLRAMVRLDDGSELEDVRLYNAGEAVYQSDVHLVEVPIYSSNRTLSAADVTLKEEGQARPVDRVIAAADAPLVVALVLDVSKSMEGHVLDLEEAAIEFVESLDDRDRVMIIAIDTVARVRLWPTSDRERIVRSIQGLPVRGATALNDGMITALLQLQSIGSRRAMVVMSDAFDNTSIFKQDDVEEVAKRSATPIYALTLNPRYDRPPTGRSMPLRSSTVKTQERFGALGRSSGGASYALRSIDKLGSYWDRIASDLREQSLVIYHPSSEGPVWRQIEVTVKKGGRVRAPSGVFVAQDVAEEN